MTQSYPVLPLRDIVVFPHMIVPLFVGREKSIRALEEVMKNGRKAIKGRCPTCGTVMFKILGGKATAPQPSNPESSGSSSTS